MRVVENSDKNNLPKKEGAIKNNQPQKDRGGPLALGNFFEQFLEKKSIFKNKKIFQSNYTPCMILNRDEQINLIANILAPSLKNEKPSNLFVYGKTGTGKTLTIKYTTNHLQEIANQRNLPVKIIYANCKLKKIADTEYRLIAALTREFGKIIPSTGLPTDEVYSIFYETLDKTKQIIILILDEIDQLVYKTGDEILYNLTRINSELKNSQISLIGISNDLTFMSNIDSRVKSSLSEEEIIFPPYNALQIQSILKQRAEQAFENEVIDKGVIEKCSAYAAREHGDARRALELLRVAGEIAERQCQPKITLKDLDAAEEKIEKDKIEEIIKSQPKQYQAIIYSIIKIYAAKQDNLFTGEIYDLYQKLCQKTDLKPLTQRRVSDVISELDILGLIQAKTISKGRYGRTREITLQPKIINNTIQKILEDGLNLTP